MHRLAIFARNHRAYIEEAVERAKVSPSEPITFRSSVRWTNAKKALDKQETLKIYLAAIGDAPVVTHEATLKILILDPKTGSHDTEAWLKSAPASTETEGLWEESDSAVKSLYVISNCKPVICKFPISRLLKASDGKPVSESYGYSYIPVLELQDGTELFSGPEELSPSQTYTEGTAKSVLVNAYERSPIARQACLAHYGLSCSVCQMNFEKQYGAIGHGFIQVHHLKPLSTIKAAYQVDPIADLRPVCPNCHAMLHRREPPYSIAELQAAFAKP